MSDAQKKHDDIKILMPSFIDAMKKLERVARGEGLNVRLTGPEHRALLGVAETILEPSPEQLAAMTQLPDDCKPAEWPATMHEAYAAIEAAILKMDELGYPEPDKGTALKAMLEELQDKAHDALSDKWNPETEDFADLCSECPILNVF